jgi:Zn-dependent protease
MSIDLLDLARNLVSFFIILLFSLCFHEFAHALVAKWRGDNTAEMMGRLTLSPFPHMDMVGTVALPLMTVVLNSMGYGLPLFGWAKPVPVNARNLKSPRTDMFWIALAGPMSNVLLAFIGTAVLVAAAMTLVTTPYFTATRSLLQQFILTNLFLAIFNALPLHPLDGGKILARFLPDSWNATLEQYEQVTGMLLLALLVMGALKYLAIPVFGAFNLLMSLAQSIL